MPQFLTASSRERLHAYAILSARHSQSEPFMKLLVPAIFEPFPEVVAGMSLRDAQEPGALSMLKNGTDETTARANRERFCQELGYRPKQLAYPEQTHSDIIHTVHNEYHRHEGDALIANEPSWLLSVTVADCVPLLLYEPESSCYGVVHSGWRGSAQNIAGHTIMKLVQEFRVNHRNLHAWIGPATGAESYEVGAEVVSQFNQKYSRPYNETTWLFDNKSVVRDQLLDHGVPADQIEICGLDTITNPELHSSRRDGEVSGRMLAAIGVP